MLPTQLECTDDDMILVPRTKLERLYAELATARREARTAQREARTDLLTGLANRRGLYEQMELWAQSIRDWAVVLLDLDKFKLVNDTLGHDVGDQVLVVTAQRLRDAAGDGAFIARLGGDEFVMLLPCHVSEAMTIVERCAAAVGEPQEHRSLWISVGTSAGLTGGRRNMTPKQVLRRVDIALYAAKESDRKVIPWTRSMPVSPDRISRRRTRGPNLTTQQACVAMV